MKRLLAWMIPLLLVGSIGFFLYSKMVTVKPTASSPSRQIHQQDALNWLKSQYDPLSNQQIKFDQAYSTDEISSIKGQVDIRFLPNVQVEPHPFIQLSRNYSSGFHGEIKGTWGNLSKIHTYHLVIYDKTDILYERANVQLKKDGTWSAGTLSIQGEAIIVLKDEEDRLVATASQHPNKGTIMNYVVEIYSVSDQPYLQATVPLHSDGTFMIRSTPEENISIRKGAKMAQVVQKKDQKVVATTEEPKYSLIRSYNVPLNDPDIKTSINQRSWLYDNALAVISFSLASDQKRASSLLDSLSHLQNEDGSLAFSYDIFTGPVDTTKRSGAIAWAGDAALTYEKIFHDSSYRSFAIQAGNYLLTQQDSTTGSIKGGPDVNWFSTEHNIDAYFFLRNLGLQTNDQTYVEAAKKIKHSLLVHHWNEQEERFNQGIQDDADTLDANAWGAIFLEATGEQDMAKKAAAHLNTFKMTGQHMKKSDDLNSFNQTFSTKKTLEGYKPFGKGYANAPEVIWTEGTWGVINLFKRQGKEAHSFINSMLYMQDADPNGGLVYTHKGFSPSPYKFHVWPSVAGTAWQYITLTNPKAIWTDD